MRKAILVVSFGTSFWETLNKTIAAVEQDIRDLDPEAEVRRAFTSEVIIKKIAQRDGIKIDNVTEALTKLRDEGYDEVVIQPTHIIHGGEYDKLISMVKPFESDIKIAVGKPLLDSVDDYKRTARALLEWLPQTDDDEALVLMGHGSEHFSNSAYCQMQYILDFLDDKTYVGTVEGFPTIEEIKTKLTSRTDINKVLLAPFMIVAGDHACNDMAGEDESWKSELEELGFEVRFVLQGIGECPAIRKIIAEHAASSLNADMN